MMASRFFPMDAVLTCSEGGSGDVSAHIPDFEEVVVRVVERSVAERGGGFGGFGLLPGFVGLDNGIIGEVLWLVVGALERRILDEEIVNEELPADIDWYYFGRVLQVRH